MFDIKEEIKKLPNKSGVYIMKDKNDEIIYVGKAVNLKNRVSQYFRHSNNHSAKVISMVNHISEFEYIITDSEIEALILECNLIKEYSPKYNIRLKDDKTYPYIKVTTNEMFPRVFITRKHLKDKAKYFGPITDGFGAKETVDLINKIWPIRKCKRKFPEEIGKERPCLNAHIGQCIAPCTGYISEEEYNKHISEIIDFLEGKHKPVIDSLKIEMTKAADDLDFERAAILRDRISKIESLSSHQKLSNTGIGDSDIIAGKKEGESAVIQIFFIRNGKMTGREHFMLNDLLDVSDTELIGDFIKQFYSGTAYIPKEILVKFSPLDKEIIEEMLSQIKGVKVSINVPIKGDKAKLLDLAEKNAAIVLERFGDRLKAEEARTVGAINEICKALNIKEPICRIESYDISNTMGFESVGSMIVFENGKPKKSDYRKFKIKTVKGANDFASMEEVLKRRLNRSIIEGAREGGFSRLPDLILVDGGRPQVTAVSGILWEYSLKIPVAGMFKDDRHRTKGLFYNGKEIYIPQNSEGFKLLTRIQDEVHRFAITYHRSLRDKKSFKWILDDIPGIGEKRRKLLLKEFGDINAIKNATLDDLINVNGLDKKSAKAVFDFFNSNEKLQNSIE